MKTWHAAILTAALLAAGAPLLLARQSDSAGVTRHLDAARAAAGTEWTHAVDYLCAANQTRVNTPSDPRIPPTHVFDDVFAIGLTGTVVYVVTTSDGLLMIDSGYGDQVEKVLLPGMRKLQLNPAQVKMVLVTHGHPDHFGGAGYFQERGAHVALSAADWDLVEQTAASQPSLHVPKRDVVLSDGQTITVGNVTVTTVLTPGHTPGSAGYIFAMRDRRDRHVAAVFGGAILLGGRASADALDQYVASIAHFADAAMQMQVDVDLPNHPLFDDFDRRLAALPHRRRPQPHPFVVGVDGYQHLLTVMSECAQAQRERRRASPASR